MSASIERAHGEDHVTLGMLRLFLLDDTVSAMGDDCVLLADTARGGGEPERLDILSIQTPEPEE